MSAVGQVYYRVLDINSGTYISSDQDIYQDIVHNYGGASQFTKIGIQAPPGTRAVLNGNKTIMIGRTGIYELDEDIAVTNLYFIRPRKYKRDDEASNALIDSGMQAMIAAEQERKTSLDQLNKQFPNVPDDVNDANYDVYWSTYEGIQETYSGKYEKGLLDYNVGKNGVYVLPNPANIDAPENYEDLYNVIVDFIYD